MHTIEANRISCPTFSWHMESEDDHGPRVNFPGGIYEGVGGVLPVGGGRCERDQRAAVPESAARE